MAKLVTIGFDNLFASGDATLYESGSAVGFPASNAFDWLTWTAWKKDVGAGSASLMADFLFVGFNYFACAAHNLGTMGGTLTLASSDDDITWTTRAMFDATVGGADKPLFVMFETVEARYWRVTLTGDASIGVVSAGRSLTIPNGQWVGETPHDLARDNEVLTTTSDAGHFLGRSLLRRGYAVSVTGEYLTPTWVNDYWLPFMIHAEVKPFFVVWPTPALNTPAHCLYCWMPGMPPRPQITAPQEMTVKFSARGLG